MQTAFASQRSVSTITFMRLSLQLPSSKLEVGGLQPTRTGSDWKPCTNSVRKRASVRTKDGQLHELDVLILATGLR